MSKVSQADLDAAMRRALKSGKPATTREFAAQMGVSVARVDSSLARVTRQDRKRKR